MNKNLNNSFLRRIVFQLLPDVFSHPVWVHFTCNFSHYSPEFHQSLLDHLQLEQTKDDLVSDCQVIFMRAFLQSRLGEHTAALASISQAWQLAEVHGLQQITRCAAWAGCAIRVRQGDYQEAAKWLGRLQEKLEKKYEWVLIDVLELFKQNLEVEAPNIKGDLLSWFIRWGEWTLPETRSLSTSDDKTQLGVFRSIGMVSRLTRHWNSFRKFIRDRIDSRKLPQRSLHQGELFKENEIRNTEQSLKPTALQHQQEQLFSAPALLPQNKQSPPRFSGLSVLPLQSDALVSTPPAAASRPSGLPYLAVYCLGQFQVYQDEQLVENWLSRKALSVFKYLILEHPVPIMKEVLMDTFWPDSDPEAARRNLHQAIYALRQILRGEQQEFHHIFFKNDCYSLHPSVEVWIDFREFEKCINDGRRLDKAGHVDKAIEQYGIAEGLYQGDFLEEDLYEDWPALQRERLRNSYFSLVDRLTELYLQTGQYTAVIHLCHKVLAKDRCYESVHRILMQCYLAQGQRHLAVRQYQTCIRALRDDLGIQPSQETVDLYHRIVPKRGI